MKLKVLSARLAALKLWLCKNVGVKLILKNQNNCGCVKM
jgi:hypothetical protein